jgi:hypothetical protein
MSLCFLSFAWDFCMALLGARFSLVGTVGRVFFSRFHSWGLLGAYFFLRCKTGKHFFGWRQYSYSDDSFSPWIFNRDALWTFFLRCFLLSFACLLLCFSSIFSCAMGDSFPPFDLNVRLELDDDNGYEENNGNVLLPLLRSPFAC